MTDRPISLYDSLAAAVRPLELRRPGHVDMYACGPTVYDHPHLGHARSALTYDVLRRYLEWRGLKVRHVANITDIDDKIIERARSEGRSEKEVAIHWEAVYVEAMDALNILAPHERPRATEWIDEMLELIGVIVEAGTAYLTSSGVYLRVRDIEGYGDLVDRELDDLRASAGARVTLDTDKEDPLDFALWKAAKQGEPSWPSPWGPGRPGWHIECAAMSLGILGEGFDIHGGGGDLVFPHHTNERAEALAAGRRFSRHWMHNAMLNIDGEKMAKSLGNFRTVADMLAEHPQNARAFRLLVLQTHYRKTMEVSGELLGAARTAVGRLDALGRRACLSERSGTEDLGVSTTPHGALGLDESSVSAFRAAMDDDLKTPQAIATIFDTVRRANAALDSGADDARTLAATALHLAGALGISFEDQVESGDDHARIETMVARRQQARMARDYATADRIRDELNAIGVIVEDGPAGSTWHRA